MAQAMILLTSHTTEATAHIAPSGYCDNATKVSYHDAHCQENVSLELLNCALFAGLMETIGISFCIYAAVKGCTMIKDINCETRSEKNPDSRVSANLNFFNSANNRKELLESNQNDVTTYGSTAYA